MPFKAPDGKEFATRAEWRDYMVATFFSFKNKLISKLHFLILLLNATNQD